MKQVASSYIGTRLQSLQTALAKAKAWGKGDPELNAYLAAYLIVLISGVYEDCIEHLVEERAAKSKDSELTSYVRKRTARTFMNPDFDKVATLLDDFSTGYKNHFRRHVDTKSRVALNSIVENKNWPAHGDADKLQVTISDVDQYFRRSIRAFTVLEKLLS